MRNSNSYAMLEEFRLMFNHQMLAGDNVKLTYNVPKKTNHAIVNSRQQIIS